MLRLDQIKRTDERLLADMANHYSQPRGFVGRNICYAITWHSRYMGGIVAGSATRYLPGRNEALGVDRDTLLGVVNNLFYHVTPFDSGYPKRNFTSLILKLFRQTVCVDWLMKYGNKVVGFESLVQLPRTGECYRRDGWTQVGTTVGYSCKRAGGVGTDSWTGQRVWDTTDLKPKLVFVRRGDG